MAEYRKKPIVIEAHQWNPKERPTLMPQWLWDEVGMHPERFDKTTGAVGIHTLEGVMTAQPGDWITKGVNNELYPCKPDIFEKTYEPA